jgi:hypothetical protein
LGGPNHDVHHHPLIYAEWCVFLRNSGENVPAIFFAKPSA